MAHSVGMLGLHDYSFMDEIPIIDNPLLFPKDHNEPAKSLEHLGKACQEFGFFYLINGVEERVVEGALKENLKIVTHPEYHCPSKPDSCNTYLVSFCCLNTPEHSSTFDRNENSTRSTRQLRTIRRPLVHSEHAIGEYLKRIHEVELGLAKTILTILGYEETYIEKEFKLEAGFDGLQMLSHKANWITVNIPRNTIFIGIKDHLEILTNGKYKSHIHQVILNNNKVKRISTATLHGPSLDTFVAPTTRLIDKSHPPTYQGMTYKESLEFNGFDEIDMQSSLIQLRMPLSH
ncbi:hypothetical protein ES288_A02G052700v1 [Gossypium darwinii]|uniref:Isopenicillin N synthase-like Fe(2+) 2OG dioxygenase domain-containing protein n=1 Tax=Gossypium darwinii TaxID=34276 RepID=A0A5D2HAH2_GOSDA|nr:hypothetical protein ES288_A02G052700v1 [Gossypium darwinii]